MKVLLVGLGGFVGSVLRYAASTWVQRQVETTGFPFGTMSVNLVGCFLIGLFNGYAATHDICSPEIRLCVVTGLLGGFTTFSSFGFDAVGLLTEKQFFQAAAYIGVHLCAGLAAVWIGVWMAGPHLSPSS